MDSSCGRPGGVTASSRARSLFIRPGSGGGTAVGDWAAAQTATPTSPWSPGPWPDTAAGGTATGTAANNARTGWRTAWGGAASRLQSGPVSQRTDLEDRRNPVARGRQPAASQFSGRLAKGAIPVFDNFLDDRLLWLHTNVGRHDNRGNNAVTHRNCLPKSRTRFFF